MVKENIRKLYTAMGLQKWLYGPRVNQPILNGRAATEPTDEKPTDEKPTGLNHADSRYISWLKEQPCALTSFDAMMSATEGKQIVVFLDYDGTLSPIVNDPDRAFMSDAMRSAVGEVARHFPTAIISGRSRDKVYGFVKLDQVLYAGSHGMDIMGPPSPFNSYDDKFQTNTIDQKGNAITIFQPAKHFLPSINKMLQDLKQRSCHIPGAFVEDNRFCISVHYRHVLNQDYQSLEDIIHNLLTEYPFFHLTRGKKVLEIRPSIKWNKGDALLYLLQTLGFSNSTHVVPLYIGDDKTDEDAFKVLKSRGQGHGIIVSSFPRETCATYSLRNPSDVLSFLIRLSRWGESLI